MYKLYTRPGSGGFVVEAALALANAPFEQVDVPKTDRPDPAFLDIEVLEGAVCRWIRRSPLTSMKSVQTLAICRSLPNLVILGQSKERSDARRP